MEHAHRVRGIARARSVAWDPHKMMLLPLAAGTLRACFLRTDDMHHALALFRSPETRFDHQSFETTGWQAHTVRGTFAGAFKKKLGLTITSEKVEGRGRVYKLPAAYD